MPLPVKRRRGLAPPPGVSPASRRPRIDLNLPMGEQRATLGDGFVDNNGIVLVLFETPTGFAIFGFCGIHLYVPDALESMWVNFARYERAREIVWLKEFQTFEDKASAINVGTGVNRQLTEMIMKWRRPKQTLVVGKEEYRSIIESSLGIPCLHDEIVMELMWGMQRHMHRLVRKEKLELPKEDRVLMSQGLQMLLSRYGFHIEPEMVNDQIVVSASALFNCDDFEKKVNPALRTIGRYLKDVFGIECKNWGALKIASAFKIICTNEIGDSGKMFSKDISFKLLEDADDYKDKLNTAGCLRTHEALVSARQCRAKNEGILASLVKKLKKRMKQN
ncbi:unnamed protein product [Urochloa decumbens]|uniref:Nucleolar protein 58/56 N-terminal domain-containing protein n=1 Tax=Urochloa decumbens TaxID=240449 RepID=A0ABC8VAY5_9POAL